VIVVGSIALERVLAALTERFVVCNLLCLRDDETEPGCDTNLSYASTALSPIPASCTPPSMHTTNDATSGEG
jgi:hypothetical protein